MSFTAFPAFRSPRKPRVRSAAGEWFAPDYDDTKWQPGRAPFGSGEQAPLPVRTPTPGPM